MKHLKEYNNWVTDVTDKNVIVNYGDKKPEMSDVVNYTKQYIEDNFDKIHRVSIDQVYFNFEADFDSIYLGDEENIYYVKFVGKKRKTNSSREKIIDITNEEYKYLSDFIHNIKKKYRKKEQTNDLDTIISEIDPVRRLSKKYNI